MSLTLVPELTARLSAVLPQGTGVASVELNAAGELIFTLTGGQQINVGAVRGADGQNGADGVSLEFAWNGTALGVRRAGETAFVCTELRGEKGEKGDPGPQGPAGAGTGDMLAAVYDPQGRKADVFAAAEAAASAAAAAQSTADAAQTAASTAQSTADAAQTAASTAQTAASAAQTAADTAQTAASAAQSAADAAVPKTTAVNQKPLSADITLTAADVGAASASALAALADGTTPAGNAARLGGQLPAYYAKQADVATTYYTASDIQLTSAWSPVRAICGKSGTHAFLEFAGYAAIANNAEYTLATLPAEIRPVTYFLAPMLVLDVGVGAVTIDGGVVKAKPYVGGGASHWVCFMVVWEIGK